MVEFKKYSYFNTMGGIFLGPPCSTLSNMYSFRTWIPTDYYIALCKWGHFERTKPTFKVLLASWTFYSFLKEFRSFNAENFGFVGQRAAKWPAIKLWEWFDPGTTRIRADWFESGRGRSADFFLWRPTLTAGNFEALWPTDPKFSALKNLNPYKKL